MPETYDLCEARLIQWRSAQSAANALSVLSPAVPAGKVWTVLQAKGYSSVGGGETQYVWFSVQRQGVGYPITRPVQQLVNVTTDMFFPCLTEGLELKLIGGDQLAFQRAAATVGSTIVIVLSYIETDLPLYVYVEPLEVKRNFLARSSIARIVGGRAVGGSSGSVVDRGGGRGPREPVPI